MVWSSKTEHEWCPPLLSASAPVPSMNITPKAVTKNAGRPGGNPATRLAEEHRDDFDDDRNHGEDDDDDEGSMFLLRKGIAPVFVRPPASALRPEAIASI